MKGESLALQWQLCRRPGRVRPKPRTARPVEGGAGYGKRCHRVEFEARQ